MSPDNLHNRIKRRLDAAAARTRYRLGIAEPDPGPAQLARDFVHPIDAGQRTALTLRYRALFPLAAERELAAARRLAAHEFNFLGHTVQHGDQIAWSRDPVSGRDWNRGLSLDVIYRGPARLGDIKLPWELSKHQYFFTLGKAAWITGDASFAVEIIRQIDHWIADNPYRRGVNWISALETGTRAVSWILAFPFYRTHADGLFLDRLSRALAQHMVFTADHLSTGRFANNHLIGDAAALVAGGLFLEHRHSRRWLDTGLGHLEREIQRQLTGDGVHVERSVAYHRFVLDQYHMVNGLLAANGRSFSPAVLAGMERMTTFLMDVLAPDGTAPTFGDGDDARGLWMHMEAPAEFRGALALGALLFAREDFKAQAGGLSEELLWLHGERGVTAFEQLGSRLPRHHSAAYPEGGYYVMRGGWGPDAALAVFDCGPVGYGPAGHGHADALSFQLYARGYQFLVDPGPFSYNLDYDWREAFRATRAHNTVVVDGLSQSVPADRMSWLQMAQARPREWVSTPWFDLVDGEHDGFTRLPDPVTHRRIFIYLQPDVWIVHDRLSGTDRHEMEALLHVRPDCDVIVNDEDRRFLLRAPHGASLTGWILDDKGNAHAPTVLTGTDQERAAWYSPGYGTKLPSKAVSLRHTFSGKCVATTCLSASGSPRPAVESNGAMLRAVIERSNGEVDSLLYRTEAGGSASSHDGQFDGTLLFERRIGHVRTAAVARSFHTLRLDGLLSIRAQVAIESLQIDGDECLIVVEESDADDVHIEADSGLRVFVNGKRKSATP